MCVCVCTHTSTTTNCNYPNHRMDLGLILNDYENMLITQHQWS